MMIKSRPRIPAGRTGPPRHGRRFASLPIPTSLLRGIAPKAALTEVFQAAAAAQRFWMDVIDREFVPGQFRAGSAILAKPLCAPTNAPPKGAGIPAHKSRSSAAARRNMMASQSRSKLFSSRPSAGVSGRLSLATNSCSTRACFGDDRR